jgi:hypothetical protein
MEVNPRVDELAAIVGNWFAASGQWIWDGVIAKSGVLAPESSGDQIDLCYLNTVFELYSGYHLGQVIEAA